MSLTLSRLEGLLTGKEVAVEFEADADVLKDWNDAIDAFAPWKLEMTIETLLELARFTQYPRAKAWVDDLFKDPEHHPNIVYANVADVSNLLEASMSGRMQYLFLRLRPRALPSSPIFWQYALNFSVANGMIDAAAALLTPGQQSTISRGSVAEAASNDHVEMLKFLYNRDPSFPWKNQVIDAAATHASLKSLTWILKQRFANYETTVSIIVRNIVAAPVLAASAKAALATVFTWKPRDQNITQDDYLYAAANASVSVFQELFTQSASVNLDLLGLAQNAIRNMNLEVATSMLDAANGEKWKLANTREHTDALLRAFATIPAFSERQHVKKFFWYLLRREQYQKYDPALREMYISIGLTATNVFIVELFTMAANCHYMVGNFLLNGDIFSVMYKSAECGFVNTFAQTLQSTTPSTKYVALRLACNAEQVPIVMALLLTGTPLFMEIDHAGSQWPMERAADAGNITIMAELRRRGSPLVVDNMTSPLSAASMNGHVAAVAWLLQEAGTQAIIDFDHGAAVAHAITTRNFPILDLLLQYATKTTMQRNFMHIVWQTIGSATTKQNLILRLDAARRRIDVDWPPESLTTLRHAITQDNVEMVRILLPAIFHSAWHKTGTDKQKLRVQLNDLLRISSGNDAIQLILQEYATMYNLRLSSARKRKQQNSSAARRLTLQDFLSFAQSL